MAQASEVQSRFRVIERSLPGDSIVAIELGGQLDAHTAWEFERFLERVVRAERKHHIVLDFHDLEAITSIRTAKKRECEECVNVGGRWVHLRTCQTCGATLCCDQSPNRHARKHAATSGHPVVASAEPGEQWIYCFPHDSIADY